MSPPRKILKGGGGGGDEYLVLDCQGLELTSMH